MNRIPLCLSRAIEVHPSSIVLPRVYGGVLPMPCYGPCASSFGLEMHRAIRHHLGRLKLTGADYSTAWSNVYGIDLATGDTSRSYLQVLTITPAMQRAILRTILEELTK